MEIPGNRILSSGSRLLRYKNALIRNAEILPWTQTFNYRGDDFGYNRTVVFGFLSRMIVDWTFRAYFVPDRLILTFSSGEVVDTGFIGFQISQPDRVSGSVTTAKEVEFININAFIMPGFKGTVFDVDLEFNLL